jgi:hypothetical protein
LASYRAFLEPQDEPDGVDLEHARVHLTAFVRREVLGTIVAGGRPAQVDRTEPGRGFLAYLTGLLQQPLRSALAVAATVLIVIGVFRVVDFRGPAGDERVLRGSERSEQLRVALARPEKLEGNRVRLAWDPVAGADGYRVEFFGADLSECARVEVGPTTSVDVDPAQTSGLAGKTGVIFYRVVVLSQGDPILRSRPRSFPLAEGP